MNLTLQKSDNIGALASGLCLIHCVATPFIFIAQTCSAHCCSDAPAWWQWIDYAFLAISFFAVLRSTKTSTSDLIKPLMWITWFALFTIILNEKFNWIVISKNLMYVTSLSLVALHLYNLKYCQCSNKECCSKKN